MTGTQRSSTYSIAQVSARFSIPASTLRYYEREGLLSDVPRDDNGQRRYTDAHLARIESIQCFKESGLPIAKIREFYTYDDDLEHHVDDIIELVEDHERELRQTIAAMRRELRHVQQKVRFYHGIKDAEEQGRPWPSWEEFAD
ncbi:transcriptional regulator MerR family [Bifidobacterium lemurum]|uniref:Transcriptional regulator MerR family n=1 Tax=Bifidobacterium lemurum TaxID=1603886 RepID=A0A261FT84_9BIFI|nr:MerR family transcriptional regulator [Bifidobacterium lemurum]OZG62400.1 transcriptional regulator MerR family [Bifidobacterium lemurum]QOL33752.1 MerR family transcriptional regulator [Bifidobacterium lemurum]